jgi:hypothetical protein
MLGDQVSQSSHNIGVFGLGFDHDSMRQLLLPQL